MSSESTDGLSAADAQSQALPPLRCRKSVAEWKAARIRGRGLGDMVKAGLEAVGITEELAQSAASAVGIKDCGCAKRRAALNAAGAKYLGLPPGLPPENQG